MADASVQTQVVKDKKLEWGKATLRRLVNFRRPYDQRRSYFYRQYVGQRDRKMYPDNITPRSNTFVPYANSNVEALVARTRDAFFSIDPPIETRQKGAFGGDINAMQAVLLTCLHKADWISNLEELMRNIAIYGHAGIKVDWDWDFDTVTGPEPQFAMQPMIDMATQQAVLDTNGQPIQLPVTGPDGMPIQIGVQMVTKQVPRNCPKLIPIDVYDLLIDPDEAIVAHMVEKSYGQFSREAAMHSELYYPEAVAEITRRILAYQEEDRDGIIIRIAEIWNGTDKTVTLMTSVDDWDQLSWKDRRYQYRNASYSAYKRRVFNAPSILLYTGPNPFAHQRIPILHMPYTKVPGDVFGLGLIEKISDLNEGVNIFVNLITDNWNMGINRRYAYNTDADIDHENLDQGNTPGGKVAVTGNPNEVLFPLPFFTPNESDYQIIDLYKGMIEMTSGISDFYAKGVGTPKGNRTSSGINQIINQSGYIFKQFISNFEIRILQPLLEMTAAMIQQYGSAEMEWDITGNPPGIPKYGRVPLASLIGNYSFDFVAANYATNKEVKQRNLMAFYNIALQSPYANQGEFLREIAKCMDIPYSNRLLKSDQQVQQEMQQNQENQTQTELLHKLVDFETKAAIEQIKKPEFRPTMSVPFESPAMERGEAVQEAVEAYLVNAGFPIEQVPTGGHGHKEGRPAMQQFEGQVPGGAAQDGQRSFAQAMGGNSTGQGGIGK